MSCVWQQYNHRADDAQNTGDIRMYYKLVDERCCYNPTQRWYYFPRITPTETLVFRQYDTREEALNRRTVFHTSAEDPTSPPHAHDRYTIEVRMQAVYGHEGNEAKAARVKRWKDGITSVYPDGTESTWFSGRESTSLRHCVRSIISISRGFSFVARSDRRLRSAHKPR
jgi:hypothetical protein